MTDTALLCGAGELVGDDADRDRGGGEGPRQDHLQVCQRRQGNNYAPSSSARAVALNAGSAQELMPILFRFLQEMRALNNYNGIMLLLSALNNSSIRRLTAEWEVRVHETCLPPRTHL